MLVPLCTLVACTGDDVPGGKSRQGEDELFHEMIQLGEKLDDPYTVENMRNALAVVYPTRSGRVDISVTDYYVRFLPRTEAQLESLLARGLDLTDHPVDYRILREGDYYHDPAVDEEEITWQYTVVGKDFDFPDDITYEILDECYLSENDPVTRAGADIDWDAVEEASFRLTGNEAMLQSLETKGAAQPQGRITIVDEGANGGKPFGLPGVKVVCNVFVKFSSTYTDRDGYYKISKKFISKPRYRLMFKNKAGFAIGFNLILVPASVSTLGKGPNTGMDFNIDKNSNNKLFCRSVITCAAYDYITMCKDADDGVTPPPGSLRIWLFRGLNSSSSPMLKHGALIDNTVIGKYLGSFSKLLKLFLPDITIGTKGSESFADIYADTIHELAHASHFSRVGTNFWDNYIKYVLKSFILHGREAYGADGDDGCGYCEVGEMWAYYMQNKLYNERYGGEMPVAGANFWFHPQIFTYLDERGIGKEKICKVLNSDVTDIKTLRAKLLSTYSDKSDIINQVFERYGK